VSSSLTLHPLDVGFLISNHFKNNLRGSRKRETSDVLYSELGGKKSDG